MTNVAVAAPAPRKMSLACLFSLIFGILGCLPFGPAILAILFAIIGFVRTGGGVRSGRWMAIVGLILGLMSLAAYTAFGGLIWALIAGTAPVRTATHDYIRDLASGDVAACMAHSSGISQDDTQAYSDTVKKLGSFKDTTFPATSITNDDATVTGIAEFSGGTVGVDASLHKDGGAWKVTKFNMSSEK